MKPRWMIKLPEPMRESEIHSLTCDEPPCVRAKLLFAIQKFLQQVLTNSVWNRKDILLGNLN